MLAREQRLARAGDFARVAKQGKREGSVELMIKTIGNGLGHPRYGIVVSTTVSKLAVVRNRIKRVIRAILREMDIHQSVDVLVVVKPPLVGKRTNEIKEKLTNLLEKLLSNGYSKP
ncbi:MAG: ribonuclease P protein component [bacterium]